MNHDLVPDHWRSFINQNGLIGTEIEFPWPGEPDLKAVIEILDEAGIEYEAREAYPGIGVLRAGFVPVGNCSIGTGDPYFINVNDGPAGPLYKIDHSQVSVDGIGRESAVAVMLDDYRDLLNYRNT